MNAQVLFSERLKQKLVEAKHKNPRVSMRSFAQQLGVSPSHLSLILNQKRLPSYEFASQVADRLAFDPLEKSAILAFATKQANQTTNLRRLRVADARRSRTEETFRPEIGRLNEEQCEAIKEWYHWGILNLVYIDGFCLDPEWIAERLAITVGQASSALATLRSENWITQDAAGKVTRTYKSTRTSDGKPNASIRHSNLQTLELAREALGHDHSNSNYDSCDFSAVTLPIDSKEIVNIRLCIRNFHRTLIDQFGLEQGADEVYRVGIQVFPLSHRSKKPK